MPDQYRRKWTAALFASACVLSMPAVANAARIQIQIENLAPSDGFSLTPLYLGLHDGSFDAFDVGSAASEGLEIVAEEGGPFNNRDPLNPVGIAAERLAVDPDSIGRVITQPDGFAGAPVIEPGEIGSVIIEIADPSDQRFLTYLSMVIASNDAFIGNDDALELFDSSGNFLGDRDILVTGNSIYDAGTEENNALDGPAFVPGNPPGSGVATVGGVITLHQGLGDFAGITQANGSVLGAQAIDFVSDRDAFQLARITITNVPEPASFALLGAGLLGIGTLRRRKAA